MKFTSDVTTLVPIRGRNLDARVGDEGINLTDRGLQRYRILWVRELGEDELRTVWVGSPTADQIEIAELESQGGVREWLAQSAGALTRKLK